LPTTAAFCASHSVSGLVPVAGPSVVTSPAMRPSSSSFVTTTSPTTRPIAVAAVRAAARGNVHEQPASTDGSRGQPHQLLEGEGLGADGIDYQDAFSKVLETVGITVPASGDHPASSGEEISEIATTTDATGVD
jgi:hypothetical protein